MTTRLKQLFEVALSAVALLATSCGSQATIERESDFNFDWKFTELKDTTTLANLPLADNSWRDVRLPHDWSVEHSFNKDLEGCTGYLPGGVGVYQKHFATPYDKDLKSTYVLFDGVYNNAKFWLNGEYLGENPYGYSPIYFDLTNILKGVGEQNVLTVYVDHSHYADSRWYTGSGIYRNVKLVTVDKLHIPIWGAFVTTPEITDAQATVNVEVAIVNQNAEASSFTLSTEIFNAEGKVVATDEQQHSLDSGVTRVTNQEITVNKPELWDIDTPNMYKAVTSVIAGGKMVDQLTTPFGIRSLVFDKDKGFFLNGRNTYVKGVCLHHDGGLVGTAVPKGVWRRRFEALKACGVNAIRTSHNPFSEEFLDLCDEMGFLVQNEIFDEMDNPKDKRFNFNEQEPLYRTEGYDNHFQKWAESDLKRTVMRDRNHPSVFQYSIGNEIEWTYPEYKHVSGFWEKGSGGYWNKIPKLTPAQMKARYDALPEQEYNLTRTAEKLAKWVKEIDTTRPVTSNLIIPVASCVTGYAAALDIVGFSYQIAQYNWCKEHFPDMHFTGSENSGYLSEWRSITDNPMVFSMYMWTGIDYMGESTNDWPKKAWSGDLLDLGGFKKAGFNHFKSIWVDEPMAAIQTHVKRNEDTMMKKGKLIKRPKSANWQNDLSQEVWNYKDGETITVEVVTNQPSATLYLNGKSLGEKFMKDNQADLIMRWDVPYEAGVLEVTAGEVKNSLKSAGAAAAITVDVDQTELVADGYDVSHIVVQVVDAEGLPVKMNEKKVSFKMEGDARFMGVDNGWNQSTQDFQSDNVITHLGQCLAIIQSNKDKRGEVTVTVSAEGLPAQTITIKTK